MTFHDVPHLEGGLSDGLDARLVNGLLQRVLAQAVQRLVDQHLQHTLDTKEGRTNSAAGPLSLLFTATFPKPRRTQHESGGLTCHQNAWKIACPSPNMVEHFLYAFDPWPAFASLKIPPFPMVQQPPLPTTPQPRHAIHDIPRTKRMFGSPAGHRWH